MRGFLARFLPFGLGRALVSYGLGAQGSNANVVLPAGEVCLHACDATITRMNIEDATITRIDILDLC